MTHSTGELTPRRQEVGRILMGCAFFLLLVVVAQLVMFAVSGIQNTRAIVYFGLMVFTLAGVILALILNQSRPTALTWGACVGLAGLVGMAVPHAVAEGKAAQVLELLPWAVVLHSYRAHSRRAGLVYAGAVSVVLVAFTLACWPEWGTVASTVAAVGTAVVSARNS